MNECPSPFYPPRAPWYRSVRQAWFDFARLSRMDRLVLPRRVAPGQFLLGLVLPGHGFAALDRPALARVTGAISALGLLLWLALLGYPAASVALATVVSIHTSSASTLLLHWGGTPRLRLRVLLTALTLAALWCLVYLPLQDTVAKHLAIPLRMDDRVVVVKPGLDPRHVKPRDEIAYRIESRGDGGYLLRAGYGIERVQAMPGDVVRFFPDRFEVNGRAQPRLDAMPVRGDFVVPEKNWFIWPRLAIVARGDRTPNVNALLLEVSRVGHEQLVGRAYRHWFFRPQAIASP